ncbi:MAG: hypothetical protein ABI836_12280, partial [Gemmatimonadota bacterium]
MLNRWASVCAAAILLTAVVVSCSTEPKPLPEIPSIVLGPSAATFDGTVGGSDPAAQAISVTNGGGGTLTGLAVGTISYGPGASGWLTASLSPSTAPASLTLQATTGALPAGSYTATVPVTSATAENSPQTVSVIFTLTDAPVPLIVLSPSTQTFTATQGLGNPSPQTVSITNGGGGSLTGLAVGTITYGAGASGWLSATLNTTTAPATLTLQPTTGSIVAGTYTATVPITSGV